MSISIPKSSSTEREQERRKDQDAAARGVSENSRQAVWYASTNRRGAVLEKMVYDFEMVFL